MDDVEQPVDFGVVVKVNENLATLVVDLRYTTLNVMSRIGNSPCFWHNR